MKRHSACPNPGGTVAPPAGSYFTSSTTSKPSNSGGPR